MALVMAVVLAPAVWAIPHRGACCEAKGQPADTAPAAADHSAMDQGHCCSHDGPQHPSPNDHPDHPDGDQPCDCGCCLYRAPSSITPMIIDGVFSPPTPVALMLPMPAQRPDSAALSVAIRPPIA